MLNESDHTYTGLITGLPRQSVTTILAEEGFIEKRFYREGRQELGSECHKLLHAVDKKLNFTAPDIYTRYIPPWKAFLKHTGMTVIDSEVEIENIVLGYSGTLDKICFHPTTGYGILDIKFSSCGYIGWHERQTEGYRQGLIFHPKYSGLKISWRGGVIFNPNCEMPKFIPHTRIRDIERKWQALCVTNSDKHASGVYFEELNKENGWVA